MSNKKKSQGEIYTAKHIAQSMLDMLGYCADRNLSRVKVLEPAAGNGVFIFELVDRLYQSSVNFGFSFQNALIDNIKAFEINQTVCDELKLKVSEYIFHVYNISIPHKNLPFEATDFLCSAPGKYHIVVGNPPYIRYDNISETPKNTYKKQFSTFRHRSDIYIAFFEHALKALLPNGALCYICSNRWLKNQYGAKLRKYIANDFFLETIINLENHSPFQEDVLAYPAITMIRNDHTAAKKYTRLYNQVSELPLKNLNNIAKPDRSVNLTDDDWASLFCSSTFETFETDFIESQGYKIGIGVATGADDIFIREFRDNEIEHELLLPILRAKDLKNNQLKWASTFLLNPFDSNGNLIHLENYPKANCFLEQHAERLKSRHVAKKNPQSWYRTIDKVSPALLKEPKILLPDMSANQYIFVDTGKYYPSHNLYFITGRSINELFLLASILMSETIRQQLAELGNTMNGGFPRWQSQNLRRLKIPILSKLDTNIRQQLIQAYHDYDIDKINSLITGLIRTGNKQPKTITHKIKQLPIEF